MIDGHFSLKKLTTKELLGSSNFDTELVNSQRIFATRSKIMIVRTFAQIFQLSEKYLKKYEKSLKSKFGEDVQSLSQIGFYVEIGRQ